MLRTLKRLVLGSVLLGCASGANAALIKFDLNYAGIGNGATGVGTITFDDAILPNPGSLLNVDAATLGITEFSITIAGATSGNGTFGLADVNNWVWVTSAALDLSTELVGQIGFDDFNWCALLFDACTPPAPGGIGPFVIQTDAETGDLLQLASMRPATPVPEPGSLALLALGLAAFSTLRRRVA